LAVSCMLAAAVVGCGSPAASPPAGAAPAPAAPTVATPPASPTAAPRGPASTAPAPANAKTAAKAPPAAKPNPPEEFVDEPPADKPKRERPKRTGQSLSELLPKGMQDLEDAAQRRREPPNEKRLAEAGIRRIPGKRLDLYTDLPANPAIDELPRIFELAIPQWCEFFGVPEEKVGTWKLTGYLMRASDTFRAVDAIPAWMPTIQNGYAYGDELWVMDQSTDYYRRHLLLHEGTHAFMSHFLGGIGPPWYGEGVAELLGTHRWQDNQLTLRYLPQAPEEVPGHGRIKIVRDDFAAGRARSLEAVFQYDAKAHLDVQPYGWCWAAASFLDAHPATHESFRAVKEHARDGGLDFTRHFLEPVAEDWNRISEDWQLFISQAEYGYDVVRASVRHKASEPLQGDEVRVKIAVDRGWQSTGVQLKEGVAYEIAAVGKYQIVAGEPTWWSEPGGVTIKYYRGQPLGLLLGAVRPDLFVPTTLTPLAHSTPIGRKAIVTPDDSGTLYLKINEATRDLHDNTGEILVRIRPVTP